MMRTLPLSRLFVGALLAGLAPLSSGCAGSASDDDDDDDFESGAGAGDTGAPWVSEPGGGDGDTSVASVPRIVDGYAGYDDQGGLGIVAVLMVEVVDAEEDLEGGLLHLTLNGNAYDIPIDGEEASYSSGRVSILYSNVDPEYYSVEMRVTDVAGNTSNAWNGELTW